MARLIVDQGRAVISRTRGAFASVRRYSRRESRGIDELKSCTL